MTQDERAALVVQTSRRFLAGYAREVSARNAWATQSDPHTEESRRMFDAVMAREAETRDLAMEMGRLVYPGESAALSAPPPAGPRQAQIAVLEAARDDYHHRIGRWLNPALNTPTKEDLLNVIGHANAAFDAALAALRAPGAADAD